MLHTFEYHGGVFCTFELLPILAERLKAKEINT